MEEELNLRDIDVSEILLEGDNLSEFCKVQLNIGTDLCGTELIAIHEGILSTSFVYNKDAFYADQMVVIETNEGIKKYAQIKKYCEGTGPDTKFEVYINSDKTETCIIDVLHIYSFENNKQETKVPASSSRVLPERHHHNKAKQSKISEPSKKSSTREQTLWTYEEKINEIKDLFDKLQDKNENSIQQFFKRMILHVHPDKNINNSEVATEVIKWVLAFRDEVLAGSPKSDCNNNTVPPKNSKKSSSYYNNNWRSHADYCYNSFFGYQRWQ